MIDDTELLNQIGRGDAAAFRALLDRHARYLFGVAHALVDNAADAEDLVQETFAAVLGSNRFRGESSVRTWLVRILSNQAGMLRRRPWKRTAHVGLDETPSPASPAGHGSTSGTDAKLDLSTMLAALSPDHRQVLVLRELEGLSYEEIAKALHLPRGTVESRLFRAREELRKKFKGYLT